jgi:hypothetical protein
METAGNQARMPLASSPYRLHVGIQYQGSVYQGKCRGSPRYLLRLYPNVSFTPPSAQKLKLT